MNAEQRSLFLAEVEPLIAKMGLDQPDPNAGRKYF